MCGYRGHITGGIVLGVVALQVQTHYGIYFPTSKALLETATGVFIGSLLPDIDHPQSVIGRIVPFISGPLYSTVGHRTLTHSFFFMFSIAFLLSVFGKIFLAYGLIIGITSHILLDMVSIGYGVAFLYPFYKKRIRVK